MPHIYGTITDLHLIIDPQPGAIHEPVEKERFEKAENAEFKIINELNEKKKTTFRRPPKEKD